MSDYISSNTMKRLPFYLEYLLKIRDEGVANVSSKAIALALNLGEVQVRKDLASISKNGRPKIGYEINSLIGDLQKFLGYKDLTDAVIFGAGKLGTALLDYNGFEECGLNVLMAFDSNPKKIGKSDSGKPIYSLEDLPAIAKSMNISIAIITVPSSRAQEVCDLVVANGIKAILNFAPVHLEAPSDVIIKNENLAYSLALLSIELKAKK
jgi:redox-sensing transcriptional repressor